MQTLRGLLQSMTCMRRTAPIPSGVSRFYASVVPTSPPSTSSLRHEPRVTPYGISPHPGSRQNQKRLGRGPSSGLGGTSTRGHKGQKARSGNGKPRPGFEGGQTPITRRFPKRGFFNQSARTWAPVNLDLLQHWINQGRLNPSPKNPITVRHLYESRCIHGVHDGVKLLGDGAEHLTSAVHIVVSRASKSAIHAIEKLGGSVVCQYYNKLALRDCVRGRTDRRMAAPTRKADILWYSDSRNRGYLSPKVRGDTVGLQAEVESRLKKRKALRSSQPSVEYPVVRFTDMLQVPKHADKA
ncbi:ribosomal protein L18e/L15P [Cantharellus anzutake]|uniref:ribosomal protein L18e/L15P n=1 Tax=Cantharellus anzutake TaxID=1750568 RepID=UPI001902E12B|nr:ribosomal protein L18e/L15P [Cantharellus anzutake]KAF8334210.1 ribosomal protein L18e/L15P [Cantharellus anzutake]